VARCRWEPPACGLTESASVRQGSMASQQSATCLRRHKVEVVTSVEALKQRNQLRVVFDPSSWLLHPPPWATLLQQP
jgi:hypothetical protein